MVLRHFFIIPSVKLEEIGLHLLTTPPLYFVHPHRSPVICNTHPPIPIYTSFCSFITSQKKKVSNTSGLLNLFCLGKISGTSTQPHLLLLHFPLQLPFCFSHTGLLAITRTFQACSEPFTAAPVPELLFSKVATLLTSSPPPGL